MNRAIPAVLAVALLSSGCVARVSAPRAVVVAEPAPVIVAPPPPVVVAPPPAIVVYPPVLVSQPRVVIVPGTQVYTVPGASFNVFVFGGHYYSYHHNTWFHAASHGAAWTPVAVAAVPVQVRTVPAAHWRTPPPAEHAERERHCPPGHAKKGDC